MDRTSSHIDLDERRKITRCTGNQRPVCSEADWS